MLYPAPSFILITITIAHRSSRRHFGSGRGGAGPLSSAQRQDEAQLRRGQDAVVRERFHVNMADPVEDREAVEDAAQVHPVLGGGSIGAGLPKGDWRGVDCLAQKVTGAKNETSQAARFHSTGYVFARLESSRRHHDATTLIISHVITPTSSHFTLNLNCTVIISDTDPGPVRQNRLRRAQT